MSRLGPRDLLGVGLVGIRTRKMRALLSSLGIAIGIATMVNLSSIGKFSSCVMYNASGPSTTHTMKLMSKYKNAASNVGQ